MKSWFILAAVLAAHNFANAGENQWSTRGPYGESYRTFFFHPSDPDVVLAAGFDGIKRSADNGKHWEALRTGSSWYFPIRSHPTRPERLLAIHDWAILESTDRGKTWQIFSELPTIDDTVTDFEFHPNDPDVLFANTYQSGIFKSKNGGKSWTRLFSAGQRGSHTIPQIEIDSTRPGDLYATANDDRIYKSANGGKTWKEIYNPRSLFPDVFGLASLKLNPADPRILYAGGWGGLFISTDAGATWLRTAWRNVVRDIAFDARAPQKIIVAGERAGRSTDGGASWTHLEVPGVLDSFLGVGIHPKKGTIFLGSDWHGLFYSKTSGKTWNYAFVLPFFNDFAVSKLLVHSPSNHLFAIGGTDLYVSENSKGKWKPFVKGKFPLTQIEDFRIHPENANKWFAAGDGLAVSSDAGKTWKKVPKFSYVQSIALDPSDENVIFAVNGSLHKSIDNGVTWKRISGLDEIVHCRDENGTLYVTTSRPSKRFLYSKDGGRNWVNITAGLPGDIVTAFATDPQDPNVLYVSVEEEQIFELTSEYVKPAVYISMDHGRTWTLRNTGIPDGEALRFLQVDPHHPARVFGCASRDVYYSQDRGLNWHLFNQNGLPDAGRGFRYLLFHPFHPGLIHAAGQSGVFSFQEK